MEAFSIAPVKASHQTAKPQGLGGLGDIFAALLLEATIRLDARPADLASFETRRTSGEPPRKTSAAETISSVDSKDWRNDVGFRGHSVANDAEAARDRIEPIAPAEATDDSEIAAPAPEHDAKPSAAAGDAAPESNADDIRLAEGEDAEAPAPAALDENAPVPEEIAAPVAWPTQAPSTAAAWARATTPSGVPARAAPQAQAATNIVPAAAEQLGAEVGATRVQVTPAAVVAQPNAALGGGAAVAALAAESGQAAAQNAGQNGARFAPASLPNAASETAATAATAAGQGALQLAKPGNRTGLNGPVAGGPVPASDTASGAWRATIAQNGSGLAPAAPGAVTAVEAAPASGLQGQSQSASIQGATVQGATGPVAGEPGSPNPQNAPTTFAESNHQNAGSSGTPGSLSAAASASEAGVQNRLGQTARTDTARSLGAPVPGANDAASAAGSQQPGASRAATDTAQGARPAALERNQNHATQNNTAQTARAEGPTQAGVAAQAVAQNAPSGTAAAAERALAPASVQRAEGAGQANANNPTAAGTSGLTLAAARAPQTLPAQARPAASLPAHQIAVHIQRAVVAGQGRIRITLHPAELGQIDVKLNIGNNGVVKAIVSIERPETFELLQRDARGLEKALQDAGLKTDSGSLSFNLKGQSEQDTAAGREGLETSPHDGESDAPAEPELAPDMIAAAIVTGAERVLDLHV